MLTQPSSIKSMAGSYVPRTEVFDLSGVFYLCSLMSPGPVLIWNVAAHRTNLVERQVRRSQVRYPIMLNL